MNTETARSNMIEQQIRPWNVLELQTLQALSDVKREDFVPAEFRDRAFADVKIPLPNNEWMLEPKIDARMAESLSLTPSSRVLEIGTGSGYLTALLATLAKDVTTIEINEELHQMGKRNLAMAGFDNITTQLGDGLSDRANADRYDAIAITGSLPELPESFFDSLNDKGRIIAIIGHEPAMQVCLFRKTSTGVQTQSLFETLVPRLKNVTETQEFVF